MTENIAGTHEVFPPPDDGRTVTIGEVVERELRALWWRSRRNGVALPAERGLILIIGGRR